MPDTTMFDPQPMGQGPMVRIVPGSIEDIKDKLGNTNVNLHRRVDSVLTPEQEAYGRVEADAEMDRVPGHSIIAVGEKKPREYDIGIQGVDSWRLTTTFMHDEDSRTEETP